MDDPSELQRIQPARFTPRSETDNRRRRWPTPLQLGLSAVLLLFALGMGFLFSARSVLFTYEPASTALEISGGAVLQLGERYLLLSGDYSVLARAAGHYDLQREITVSGEESQNFHLQLQPLPGRLAFSTVPAGATVLVDGRELGLTPLVDQPIEAGKHQLRLLAERYLPHRQTLLVEGMEKSQSVEVALVPAWANIAISSIPVGATVLLDGKAVATTPALLRILQGEHQIGLQMPRHRSWRQSLSVSAGVHQNLEPIKLKPASGILTLSSTPASANVTVDGEYRGQTPLELSLEPGASHRVSIFKPGYSNAVRKLALKPEQRRRMHLRLQPQLGEVRLTIEPPDAEVLVNGQSRGRGSQTLKLPSFEHSLVVRRDGYRSHRQRFTPRPGLGQVLKLRLLTEAEARLAELSPMITTRADQTLKLFTPGDLTMGASRREPGRRANEVLHPVSLTRLFYLGTHEVNNRQFRKFRQDHSSGAVEGNSLNRDTQPVVMVSWTDAALYCNWLSKQENLPAFYQLENGKVVGFDANSHGYRLPTEAEWAWAARVKGDELLKYPWGKQFPPRQVLENYADTTSAYITGRTVPGYSDGHILSAPVGSFQPNHRDLFDLGGNVAEWVHDTYGVPGGRGVPVVDPLGAQQGGNHVIRGASWARGTVTELRLSFRDYGNAGRDDVGFRVARFAEEAPQ